LFFFAPPPPQVLLQVEARGLGYYHAGSDTWAASQLRPLRILAQLPTMEDAQFLEPLAALARRPAPAATRVGDMGQAWQEARQMDAAAGSRQAVL
jgi:hypothetical protein